MARVNFGVRIGRRTAESPKREERFTGRLDAGLIDRFRTKAADMLGVRAIGMAEKDVQARLKTQMPKVQAAIRADLQSYSRNALRFFFTRRSSRGSNDLVINLADVRELSVSSGFFSNLSRSQLRSYTEVIRWAPLSEATIERKFARGQDPLAYFVGTGQLKGDMQTRLPQFFENVLNPGIQVTFSEDIEKQGRGKKPIRHRVASVELLVATRNLKGLQTVAFQRGGLTTPGPMNSTLLRGYLESQMDKLADDLINKLENRGGDDFGEYDRPQRPWIEAAMSFWVLRRLPKVFQQSIKRNVLGVKL